LRVICVVDRLRLLNLDLQVQMDFCETGFLATLHTTSWLSAKGSRSGFYPLLCLRLPLRLSQTGLLQGGRLRCLS
jgi:hypothetical protein